MAIGRTKKQQRKAAVDLLKRLATAMVIVFAIVAAFRLYDFLTTDDRFSVGEISFVGVTRLSEVELDRLVHDLRGQNIVLAPVESYQARIENHPRIKSARIRRVLPATIVCTVEEREPVALVYASEFLEVDDEGFVMPEDELTSLLDLPIISG